MLYKTHFVFAVLISLLLNLDLISSFILVLCSFIPDIDIQTSKIGKKFKILSFLANKLFSHRGFFHSLLFVLIIYFILKFIFTLQDLPYLISLGILSHLVLDSLTKEGISLFSPFLNFRIKGFITTGSFIEKLFFIFLVILSLALFFLF